MPQSDHIQVAIATIIGRIYISYLLAILNTGLINAKQSSLQRIVMLLIHRSKTLLRITRGY